jgi:hypothetical protein
MTTRHRPLPRRSVAILAGAALFSAAAGAQEATEDVAAESRDFSVEVIVFRYSDSVSAGSEVFVPDDLPPLDGLPEDMQIPTFGDDTTSGEVASVDANDELVPLDADGEPVELDEDGNPIGMAPRADYVLLLDEELTLGNTLDRLERLDAYQPLAHFGWQQRVKPYEEPVAIPLADLVALPEGLDGEFTLYLSRFLHLVVNVEQLAEPAAEPESDPLFSYADEAAYERYSADGRLSDGAAGYSVVRTGPVVYRIEEDRIFKSGDLRYFDHPRIGVLARIDRVEAPEPDDEPAVGQVQTTP